MSEGAQEQIRVTPSEVASKIGIDPRTGEKLRVVILNQYYAPDVASTGHLLHELATELAKADFNVQVLTSRPSYGPPDTWVDCPMREMKDGVDIRRLWTTRFSKDNLLGRAVNYLSFMGQLFLRVLFTSRRDTVYLYTTNPPFLAIIGALTSLVRKHNYVMLLHDAYPHMAVWVGTIRRRGIAERVWHLVNRLCYGRARQSIVLCQKARELVTQEYKVKPQRVHVIPNWADGNELTRRPKPSSVFATKHDLQDYFTVLYSGNLGLYYEFETIMDAAERLVDAPFRLILVGGGGKKSWIADQIERRELANTKLLNYVPFPELPDSLSAADASLVSIAEGIEGISFPSKLYTSLAVGRAVLALSEEDSELREIIETHRVGMWCELGDSDRMEHNIRTLIDDPQRCDRMGERARRLFERAFTKERCAERYASVLEQAHPLTPEHAAHVSEGIGAELEVEGGEEDAGVAAAG
ncbi:MAG: glycosyltransferase family 4 protein [Planctomycetota bacterium]